MSSPIYILELLYDGQNYDVPANDAGWREAIERHPVVDVSTVLMDLTPRTVLAMKIAMTSPIDRTLIDLMTGFLRDAPELFRRFREYAHAPRTTRIAGGRAG